jgi:hypothetical protein
VRPPDSGLEQTTTPDPAPVLSGAIVDRQSNRRPPNPTGFDVNDPTRVQTERIGTRFNISDTLIEA